MLKVATEVYNKLFVIKFTTLLVLNNHGFPLFFYGYAPVLYHSCYGISLTVPCVEIGRINKKPTISKQTKTPFCAIVIVVVVRIS